MSWFHTQLAHGTSFPMTTPDPRVPLNLKKRMTYWQEKKKKNPQCSKGIKHKKYNPSIFYKSINKLCEQEISFTDILKQNYPLQIFFLTLTLLLTPINERTKWVVTDMVDPSNPLSLMQEINIWFWCEESLHVFLPRPEPRYSFLWWHSQRGNGCEICFSHIHQNVFFHLFFSFSFSLFRQSSQGFCPRTKIRF